MWKSEKAFRFSPRGISISTSQCISSHFLLYWQPIPNPQHSTLSAESVGSLYLGWHWTNNLISRYLLHIMGNCRLRSKKLLFFFLPSLGLKFLQSMKYIHIWTDPFELPCSFSELVLLLTSKRFRSENRVSLLPWDEFISYCYSSSIYIFHNLSCFATSIQ